MKSITLLIAVESTFLRIRMSSSLFYVVLSEIYVVELQSVISFTAHGMVHCRDSLSCIR
jgi:hypothetical protein